MWFLTLNTTQWLFPTHPSTSCAIDVSFPSINCFRRTTNACFIALEWIRLHALRCRRVHLHAPHLHSPAPSIQWTACSMLALSSSACSPLTSTCLHAWSCVEPHLIFIDPFFHRATVSSQRLKKSGIVSRLLWYHLWGEKESSSGATFYASWEPNLTKSLSQ